jgi:hypothetical protein
MVILPAGQRPRAGPTAPELPVITPAQDGKYVLAVLADGPV